MAADCGELVSVREVEVDPELVQVVEGSCSITPLVDTPTTSRTLAVTVENDNQGSDVSATVEWVLQEVTGEPVLTTFEILRIPAAGSRSIETTVTPAQVAGVPDEFRSRVPVRVVTESVSEVEGGPSPFQSTERAHAGVPQEGNGEHRAVPDGGARESASATRAALARACGGCADRSRRLTEHHRRLRDRFAILGG